jgi:MFS family permease
MVAQLTAIISFIPIGIFASRIGRKKAILIGIIILSLSFRGRLFYYPFVNIFYYIVFVLAGLGWATIKC